jgi:DNA-binding transcriptional MerR regulator
MAEAPRQEEKAVTIGQASKDLGLPVSTIRFYEKEFGGYLKLQKTPGGHRRFQAEDVEKLRRIHRLVHDQGRSLKDVKLTLMSDRDPLHMRRELDLLLEVFENLVQENVKIHKAIEEMAARITALEGELQEGKKKKRFGIF